LLWKLAREVVSGSVTSDVFSQSLSLSHVAAGKLTQAMFWLNPDQYFPVDSQTRPFLQEAGIPTDFDDFTGYTRICDAARAAFPGKRFCELSYDAWLANQNTGPRPVKPGPEPKPQPEFHAPSYWWLNANPKMWSLEEMAVGQTQTYTSHNESGNRRQKYKHFQEVKPGDLVVGYVTSPQKEVVAVCKITKSLHQTKSGEEIELEKVEQLAKPIAYQTLQANPDLIGCEPISNNQGSLFQLTVEEYEIIRSLIDETNIPVKTEIEYYDKKKAMTGLFLAETQFDEMLDALKEKKNVVLQPGISRKRRPLSRAGAEIRACDGPPPQWGHGEWPERDLASPPEVDYGPAWRFGVGRRAPGGDGVTCRRATSRERRRHGQRGASVAMVAGVRRSRSGLRKP
jgi:predicted RNA-binding protein with PUA-like domain